MVIAIRNRKENWKVYELLTGERYGINKEKVIPFYVYAKGEYWDICMEHTDVNSIQGLIFGTSYARYGILPKYLSVPFINLSVPSQDLYRSAETFKEYFFLDFEDTKYERWKCIEQFAPLLVRMFTADIVTRRFDKTIEENIEIFNNFLDAIQSFNLDIKIFLIMIPRYASLEDTKNVTSEMWKEEFDKIINPVCQRKNVYLLNYKNCKEISENRRFYFDVEHLNTIGGRCMTAIIDDDIKRYI